MHKFLIPISLLCFAAVRTVLAQETAPASGAVASPSPAIEPPQLIPAPPMPAPSGVNTGPSGAPDLSQLDEAFKPAPMSKEAQEYKLRVEWRQLQNRTENDAAVTEAKDYAEAAPTDLEKRHRLRAYYETYYKRMRALAETPEMKAYLDAQMNGHIGMLAQPRVRPTPTPTPTPAARKSVKP
jgi:hypothetical protein